MIATETDKLVVSMCGRIPVNQVVTCWRISRLAEMNQMRIDGKVDPSYFFQELQNKEKNPKKCSYLKPQVREVVAEGWRHIKASRIYFFY